MKNSLPYLKCVLRLSCVVHGPICGRFMVETIVFFFSHTNPYKLFWMSRNSADTRRCSYFELGLPVLVQGKVMKYRTRRVRRRKMIASLSSLISLLQLQPHINSTAVKRLRLHFISRVFIHHWVKALTRMFKRTIVNTNIFRFPQIINFFLLNLFENESINSVDEWPRL